MKRKIVIETAAIGVFAAVTGGLLMGLEVGAMQLGNDQLLQPKPVQEVEEVKEEQEEKAGVSLPEHEPLVEEEATCPLQDGGYGDGTLVETELCGYAMLLPEGVSSVTVEDRELPFGRHLYEAVLYGNGEYRFGDVRVPIMETGYIMEKEIEQYERIVERPEGNLHVRLWKMWPSEEGYRDIALILIRENGDDFVYDDSQEPESCQLIIYMNDDNQEMIEQIYESVR